MNPVLGVVIIHESVVMLCWGSLGGGIIQNKDLLSSRGCRVTLLSEV